MQGLEARKQTSHPVTPELDSDLSIDEREVLQEVLRALRAIRYGSVVLTVHDAKIAEIQKTERIRRGAARKKL
jgi:hypothetical protein